MIIHTHPEPRVYYDFQTARSYCFGEIQTHRRVHNYHRRGTLTGYLQLDDTRASWLDTSFRQIKENGQPWKHTTDMFTVAQLPWKTDLMNQAVKQHAYQRLGHYAGDYLTNLLTGTKNEYFIRSRGDFDLGPNLIVTETEVLPYILVGDEGNRLIDPTWMNPDGSWASESHLYLAREIHYGR